MPGRKSNQQILSEQGVDYFAMILDLEKNGLSPADIAGHLNRTYGMNTQPTTVRQHLQSMRQEDSGLGRTSVESLLKRAGVHNYKEFLKSLSYMSPTEISAYLKKNFSVTASPITIYNHGRDFNIQFSSPNAKVRSLSEIRASVEYSWKSPDKLLIDRDLPLKILFNGTDESGYITLIPIAKVVFEVVTSLEIKSREEGVISLFLRIFKDPIKTETEILFQEDVSSLLPQLSNSNYVSLCKSKIKHRVDEIKEMSQYSLLQLLKNNASSQTEMESIIEYLKGILE